MNLWRMYSCTQRLESGKEYFIVVYGYDNATGTDTLEINCDCSATDGDTDTVE